MTAALIALILVTFDPNILAHSALVTADIGVSLFFLASIYGIRCRHLPTIDTFWLG